MKSVLISIQPKWCELIASGKKTVEVRKTKPKLEPPFKVYIYQTKHRERNGPTYSDGKVIGEFVCDNIFEIVVECEIHNELPSRPVEYWESWENAPKEYETAEDIEKATCLAFSEIKQYIGAGSGCYCWHISNLVIYDKPKKLSQFTHTCKHYDADSDLFCYGCECFYEESNESVGYYSECLVDGFVPIKKPPQSWCYVEENDHGKQA